MARIETSIEIAAPIEKVFAFLSNPENQEKILPNTKIEDVSKQPIGVGTKYRISAVISRMKVGLHWHETLSSSRIAGLSIMKSKADPVKRRNGPLSSKT